MTLHKAGRVERFIARRVNWVAYQLNKINCFFINREYEAARMEEFDREWEALEARRRRP